MPVMVETQHRPVLLDLMPAVLVQIELAGLAAAY